VFTYLSGWDGSLLYNDVFVSSDGMITWTRVRSNWGDGLPPWPARDAANAEMTASGVIVIIGGTTTGETLSARGGGETAASHLQRVDWLRPSIVLTSSSRSPSLFVCRNDGGSPTASYRIAAALLVRLLVLSSAPLSHG
jgi:hypothetical protein